MGTELPRWNIGGKGERGVHQFAGKMSENRRKRRVESKSSLRLTRLMVKKKGQEGRTRGKTGE